MRNETKLVLFFVIASALLGFTQVPIVSATSSTPNVFEILSYGGDITFIGGNGMTKMQVIGAEEFVMPDLAGTFPIFQDGAVHMSSGGKLYAPAHLPDGATVTEFACSFVKQESSNYNCQLLNSPFGDRANTNMATVNTNSLVEISGTPQIVSTNIINDAIVDRDSKNYSILFDQTNFGCASNCKLESAKITYTVPSGMVVGGNFYPVDNVSLVLAYSLVNSWWMAPIGIGIGLGIYLVKRKIE